VRHPEGQDNPGDEIPSYLQDTATLLAASRKDKERPKARGTIWKVVIGVVGTLILIITIIGMMTGKTNDVPDDTPAPVPVAAPVSPPTNTPAPGESASSAPDRPDVAHNNEVLSDLKDQTAQSSNDNATDDHGASSGSEDTTSASQPTPTDPSSDSSTPTDPPSSSPVTTAPDGITVNNVTVSHTYFAAVNRTRWSVSAQVTNTTSDPLAGEKILLSFADGSACMMENWDYTDASGYAHTQPPGVPIRPGETQFLTFEGAAGGAPDSKSPVKVELIRV
jgi:hypothetical protein